MAGHIVGLELRGLQRRFKDWCGISQLAGHVGEGGVRDGVIRAQVVVEGGPVWTIEAIVQVIWTGAILIAWPEMDSSLSLCLNPGHVAQLSIDLCQGGGRQGAGLNSCYLKNI
jgi:hypothetical protein